MKHVLSFFTAIVMMVLLEKSEGGTGTVPERVFYTSESFPPGCRLEITASHSDLPSVRTVTEVPDMFPECSVEVRKIAMSTQEYLAMSDMNGGSTYNHSEALRVHLEFQDAPSRKDYYGLRIIRDNGFSLSLNTMSLILLTIRCQSIWKTTS